MSLTQRRAKIVCTIGPASDSEVMLTQLLESGMNVARFNFSHGGPQQQNAAISRLRAISQKLDKPVAILQDLQGPRIRLGDVQNGGVEINSGETLTLTTREIIGNHREASVSYATLENQARQQVEISTACRMLRLLTRAVLHDIGIKNFL